MKPKIDTFREALKKCGGNITKVAAVFHVQRGTVYLWARENEEYSQAIKDCRGALVDDCLISARVLALGIPQKDADGNFIGWIERPDGSMLRYLLSTLGRKEGFGESNIDEMSEVPTNVDKGVDIDAWIKKEVGK